MESLDLTDHFLIAMPAMADPYFSRSLVYLCEHNPQGALGVIVNRPIDLTLAGLFEKVDLPLQASRMANLPVYFGGPVQTDRGFVLHRPRGEWQSSLGVTDEIALTSSKDILTAIGERGEPADILMALGYAGWGAGQLENELAQNAWLTVRADAAILFGLPPEERLAAAMQKLGISFSQLADTAGHA
ncbi:YqgE/AlgH family protein [Azovibrio restrictus]|uniref:YqgE/AlgH family protein n=1 Tax=Azovibrio restrictus TaxID=146938 RepID=UPI0026F2BE09|nr:YqgE/AlgH family protein [Azovibrio restrictus]